MWRENICVFPVERLFWYEMAGQVIHRFCLCRNHVGKLVFGIQTCQISVACSQPGVCSSILCGQFR